MHNQAYVIRAFFSNQADAETAHAQMENIGVFGDFIAGPKTDPHPFKVVFTDTSLNLAKNTLRRIALKPVLAQVFDPTRPPEFGWGEFRSMD